MCCSLHLGDGDASGCGVVVSVGETVGEGGLLHSLVVPGADRVQVGSGLEVLERLLAAVQFKDLLHAVVELAHVVAVLTHFERTVDLVSVHLFSRFN